MCSDAPADQDNERLVNKKRKMRADQEDEAQDSGETELDPPHKKAKRPVGRPRAQPALARPHSASAEVSNMSPFHGGPCCQIFKYKVVLVCNNCRRTYARCHHGKQHLQLMCTCSAVLLRDIMLADTTRCLELARSASFRDPCFAASLLSRMYIVVGTNSMLHLCYRL